jgi:hypothetical protein
MILGPPASSLDVVHVGNGIKTGITLLLDGGDDIDLNSWRAHLWLTEPFARNNGWSKDALYVTGSETCHIAEDRN